jgi:hypothetical protein
MAKKIKLKDVEAPIKSSARQFREHLTRVVAPVVQGKKTQAKQWGRWTP